MFTVRFDNGLCIQYNTANFVTHGEHDNVLRDKENGGFIAVVPKTAVVDCVQPCRIYNATNPDARIEQLEKTVRSLTRKLARLAGKK